MFKEQIKKNQEQDNLSQTDDLNKKNLSHPDLPKEVNNYIDSLMKQLEEKTKELQEAKEKNNIEKQSKLTKEIAALLDLMTRSKQKKKIIGAEEEEIDPEEIKKSIEEIKQELSLDIAFSVDDEGTVKFEDVKEKIDQIISILTRKNNKLIRLNLGYNKLGPAAAEAIAQALCDPNNKLTYLALGGATTSAPPPPKQSPKPSATPTTNSPTWLWGGQQS